MGRLMPKQGKRNVSKMQRPEQPEWQVRKRHRMLLFDTRYEQFTPPLKLTEQKAFRCVRTCVDANKLNDQQKQ